MPSTASQRLDDVDAAVARGAMEGGGPGAATAEARIAPYPTRANAARQNAPCMRLHAHAARRQHADGACG